MGNELTNIDAFKNAKPSQAFAVLNPTDDNLASGIGSSYGVIGYRGKVWSFRYQGEKYTIVRPDDGTPASYLDVIILRQAQGKSKSFYGKYDPAVSHEGERPICASIDGVVPDVDVAQKQSDTCALCPRNVWKTDENGRKGRECADYKRLAVLLLPAQTQKLLGKPLMEPVFLRIPPASLNNLAVMGEAMANQGWHFSSYITRISFDPSVAHPQMVFKPLQGLTDAEAPVVLPLRGDPLSLRIVGEANQPLAITHTTPATAPATAPVAPVAQPTPVKPVAAVTNTEVPPVANSVFSTEVLEASPTSLKLNPEPAPQTVADTGEAVESDADLDDRIAALMKSPT